MGPDTECLRGDSSLQVRALPVTLWGERTIVQLNCYHVGDRVIATRYIWQDANEDHPAGALAECGDSLEVRRVSSACEWPVYVAHPCRGPEEMFGVNFNEIRLAEPLPEEP